MYISLLDIFSVIVSILFFGWLVYAMAMAHDRQPISKLSSIGLNIVLWLMLPFVLLLWSPVWLFVKLSKRD